MEYLTDYTIVALLLVAFTAVFGFYALGMLTLRAVVNWCVGVLGASSFAMWARRQKNEAVPPKEGSFPHDSKSDDGAIDSLRARDPFNPDRPNHTG